MHTLLTEQIICHDNGWDSMDFGTVPARPGVCMFCDTAGQPILLLTTGSIRTAAAGRLGKDISPARSLAPITTTLHYCLAGSAFEATLLHYNIARHIYGPAYQQELSLRTPWCIRIDPQAHTPEWTVTTGPTDDKAWYFGPMPARKDAHKLIETITDIFDMCRYQSQLRRAPHGRRCVWYELGRCQAPCDGSMDIDEYRQLAFKAIDALDGTTQPMTQHLQQQMRQASEQLAFEQAATYKQRLASLEHLGSGNWQWAQPLHNQRILIIQRGVARASVRLFVARNGYILTGPELPRRLPKDQSWAAHIEQACTHAEHTPDTSDAQTRTDHLAILTHFLFRHKDPGLYMPWNSAPPSADIAERIEQHFSRRSKDTPDTANPDPTPE